MDKPTLSLELVPMDGEPPPEAAKPPQEARPAAPPAARDIVPTTEETLDAIEIVPLERAMRNGSSRVDDYGAQAAREYAEGKIDTPLWDRALGKASGDATAAAAIYVRARAVALRLIDRDRRTTGAPQLPRQVQDEDDDEQWRARQRLLAKSEGVWSQHRYAIIGAALAVGVAGIGGLWALSRPATEVRAPAIVAAAAAKTPSAVAAVAPHEAAPKVAPTDFPKKVQELRDAGNWNVLVLYAVEWTRKQPADPAAWDNLRMGYMYLRQFDDALAAATKATQLAPDEARYWRHLGEVSLELDDPAAALPAFEQAAARNSADLDSLHQVGLLQARLGRPLEAKEAFDRAMAASPGDATTACLRTAVAQMPQVKDAYSMSRQIRAIDNRCHGRSENVAASK